MSGLHNEHYNKGNIRENYETKNCFGKVIGLIFFEVNEKTSNLYNLAMSVT